MDSARKFETNLPAGILAMTQIREKYMLNRAKNLPPIRIESLRRSDKAKETCSKAME